MKKLTALLLAGMMVASLAAYLVVTLATSKEK